MTIRYAALPLSWLAFTAHAQSALPEHVKPDGPQQTVIYSEHFGNAGVGMGQAAVVTCKGMCPSPAFPKKCAIEGDALRHGEYLRRTWRTANASTDYTETWAMLPTTPGDVCVMRLQLLRTLRIQTPEGDGSTILRIDLNRGEGTRKAVKKSRRPASDDTERTLQALRASGYEPAGTARYAGYSCRLLRRTKGELVQEACLLEDPAAPDAVLGVPVKHMTLAHSMINPAHPEARIYGETQLLKFDAMVPAAVFTPPTNIQWSGKK